MHAFPRIRLAGVFPLDDRGFAFCYQSQTHAIHLHEYAAVIRMDGRELPIQPGTLTLSPATGRTWYDLPSPGSHWCIHFHPQPVRRGQPAVRLPLHRHLGERQVEFAERMAHIARLHAMAQRGRPSDCIAAAAASTALQEMLLRIALLDESEGPVTQSRSTDPIDRLLRIIHRELHTPLHVPELAARAGLTQNYLARLFRHRMGMTIPRYILRRRIDQARLMLTTTDLPVKLIAARVGLPDPQHFNKQFRRLTERSPTAVRMANEVPPRRG